MGPIAQHLEAASRAPLALTAPPSKLLVRPEEEWAEVSFAGEACGLGQRWDEVLEGMEDLPLRTGVPRPIRLATRARAAEDGGLAPLCVVLDLDHTLVYSQDTVGQGYDFSFTKGNQAAHVWKRPGLDGLLSWLRQSCVEAVVYTAASSSYAEGVSRHLDPEGTLFRRRLSRRDCPLTPPAKDLLRLGRDMRRTVLVDDSLSALRLQPDNGILVGAYTGGLDEELPRVQALLEELLVAEDVRKVLHGRFRIAERLRKKATRAAVSAIAADAAAMTSGRPAQALAVHAGAGVKEARNLAHRPQRLVQA